MLVAVAGAALLAGCGVRIQDEPESVERREVPFGLLEPRETEIEEDARASFVVFFERGGSLFAVPRVSATPATPEAVVDAVLRGPTLDEALAGIRSAIPAGTELVALSRFGSAVSVDLSATFREAEDLATALRQIDSTLRELPGIDSVRILVEGAPAL